MSPKAAKVQLNDSEWRVMQILWRRGRCTARDVHQELSAETSWAYTTVKTVLDRLVSKELLGVTAADHVLVYESRITPESARRNAVRALLDRAFGGSFAPFARFLVDEELTAGERAELQSLLDDRGPAQAESKAATKSKSASKSTSKSRRHNAKERGRDRA